MAKIYLTGMTASQASASANSRNLAFAGVLNNVLTASGHDVTWEDPSLDVTEEFLKQFDSVLVGVGPLTSIAANRVYGALNIIGMLWGSDKLKLFIDAPGMAQIGASLKSVNKNPMTLIKDFYSYRKGYKEVISNVSLSAKISTAVDNLATKPWPQTIYPALPWKTDDQAKEKMSIDVPNFSGVSLDSHLILDGIENVEKAPKWVADSTAHRDTKKLVDTLGTPVLPMKWNKGWTDEQVYEQIKRSSGAIISVNKGDGSWWTYRYIQALNAGTPVYTSWAETSNIGESWSHLAHTIEDMSDSVKVGLSIRQRIDYLKNIPNKTESIKQLESLLGLSQAEGK
jgi:hypothetical protein